MPLLSAEKLPLHDSVYLCRTESIQFGYPYSILAETNRFKKT